jgi:tripartite-type tricarboxylate transporter receptor subunit TctC
LTANIITATDATTAATITLVSKVPSLYVVHPDLPVKNLKEFIAYAKARTGQLNYG